MKSNSQCWCGSYNLADYSPAYWHCHSCDTLVSKEWQQDASAAVKDEGEFYGKDYFLEHQQQGGHPSLHERVRNDLTDRIPHWISALLKYRVPPARVLELGSAHGGFVAFLNWAGYDAMGLDLSPWVTQFARDIFGVPMLQGSLASQFLQPASLDIIAHMDVLEHLAKPLETMRSAIELLKPDGIMLLQTPCFDPDISYRDLLDTNHPFIKMLIPEHLFIFSKQSLHAFFAKFGYEHIIHEPAFFPQYDMFTVVSRIPLRVIPDNEREASLKSLPSGRLILALLDLFRKVSILQYHADERLKVIQHQSAELEILRMAAQERLELIVRLNNELNNNTRE